MGGGGCVCCCSKGWSRLPVWNNKRCLGCFLIPHNVPKFCRSILSVLKYGNKQGLPCPHQWTHIHTHSHTHPTFTLYSSAALLSAFSAMLFERSKSYNLKSRCSRCVCSNLRMLKHQPSKPTGLLIPQKREIVVACNVVAAKIDWGFTNGQARNWVLPTVSPHIPLIKYPSGSITQMRTRMFTKIK